MKKLLLVLFCTILVCTPAFSKKTETVKKPFVVTFYKNDCEECEALNEVKQEIMQEYKGKVDFVKINFESDDYDFKRLKARYNIRTAPATIFVNIDKGITKKKDGYISFKEYESKIKAILND